MEKRQPGISTAGPTALVTLPYLRENPKPVWDLVFILRQTSMGFHGTVSGAVQGDQETVLELMGKRVYCTHSTAGHGRVV